MKKACGEMSSSCLLGSTGHENLCLHRGRFASFSSAVHFWMRMGMQNAWGLVPHPGTLRCGSNRLEVSLKDLTASNFRRIRCPEAPHDEVVGS